MLVAAYQREFGLPGIPYSQIEQLAPDEIREYEALQRQVVDLLQQADKVAAKIRIRMDSLLTAEVEF